MQDPATASWGLSISDADFKKLKAGFQPQMMEDKWHVFNTGQSQSSNISIHFDFGWRSNVLYVLDLKPSDDGSSNGAQIEAITWAQKKGEISISEEQGKKEVVLIARRLLGCDFETLPDYDSSIVWDHPGAQIGAK
jgi:hypothetical protein